MSNTHIFEFFGKNSLLVELLVFFSLEHWRFVTLEELCEKLDRPRKHVIRCLEQLLKMELIEKKGDNLYRYNQDEKKIKDLQEFIGRENRTYSCPPAHY
ncbi:MAG: MarR family transcriptional regulator [Candidatus Eremiobacteraeota bacterium]|nr:MarR family transcriptional regulator [Candidatus Eremiobacteraeota bacterium]